MKTVCVCGLGYTGLPLLCLTAERGYKVYGIDIDEKKIGLIKEGISPIKDKFIEKRLRKFKNRIIVTTDYKTGIKSSEIVIICVPTPVDKFRRPDLSCIISCAKEISKHLKPKTLVIVESTIGPGTTREIIKPLIEQSGLIAGEDFYLAYCPERLAPGSKKWNIRNIPRVISGINKRSTYKAYMFYKSVLDADITKLSSLETAEATKIFENTFRDVNIAFVNEMAKSFEKLNIDIIEVIKGASTKPFAFLPHYPGCGVGGHCIPVDPYYLMEKSLKVGFEHEFLRLSRKINNSMPDYLVQKIIEGANEINKTLKHMKIVVLGLAYKGEVSDIRESPALQIIKKLREYGCKISVYDPYVIDKSDIKSLSDALNTECIVIATDHQEFRRLKLETLKRNGVKLIVDGRNILDKRKVMKYGIVYKGVGR